MKNVVIFFVLAVCNACHIVLAHEPSIVLVTLDGTFVYGTKNGSFGLLERRSNGIVSDEKSHGQPLKELSNRKELVSAYLANSLDCGRDVVAPEPLNEWIQQENDSQANNDKHIDALVTKPVNNSYIIVSAKQGIRALVLDRNSGRRLRDTPCGTAVKLIRLSPSKERVGLVFEDLKEVEFFGRKGNILFVSRSSGTQSVQIHNLGAASNFTNAPPTGGEPVDLMLPDNGNWWLLVAKHSSEWWKPLNWLLAVGGHGTKRSDIFLQTYSSEGVLLSNRKIATGVVLVAGRIVSTNLIE